jgi:hypothetical protein
MCFPGKQGAVPGPGREAEAFQGASSVKSASTQVLKSSSTQVCKSERNQKCKMTHILPYLCRKTDSKQRYSVFFSGQSQKRIITFERFDPVK